MVQYILKRNLTGSTVTVDGSETINELWEALDRMIVCVSILKVEGEDHKLLAGGVLPKDAVEKCKQIFMQRLFADVEKNLIELGEGWSYEDMHLPKLSQPEG
jgi:hypothetical protein